MDHRNALTKSLVHGHLTEEAIEALATDRGELLEPEAHTHHQRCPSCSVRVRDAGLLRSELDVAFQAPEGALSASIDEALIDAGLSDAALDAMVRGALGPASSGLSPVAAPMPATPAVSRRSLAWAFSLGSITAIALGLLSLDGLPSITGTLTGLGRLWTLGSAASRLVQGSVPGGWAGLALGLSLLLLGLVAPLRRLLVTPQLAATALMLLSVALPGRAWALDFTGTWPEEESLTVVADDVPSSVALENAAAAAGLGFIGALPADPNTHLRVRGASLRDVVIAVLGPEAPFVVDRSATLLTIRSVAPAATSPVAVIPMAPVLPTAPATPTFPATPMVPVTPTPPNPPASNDDARRNARDRTSFGGNVRVGPGEVVASVVTMGGNAEIEGEVLQDVVSMGGNVHVYPTGSVRGDIVAMGGRVQVDPGADVVPDAVQHTDGEWEDWEGWGQPEAPESPGDALIAWVGDTLASGARHTLLFLFGLLLLGLLPARLTLVMTTLKAAPGRSVMTGFLSAAAALVLGIVLLITLIGIPGAVVLALTAAVASYAGLVAVAMILGRALPVASLDDKPVLQLGAGVAILFVTSLVPFFGTLTIVLAGFFGVGAVVLTRAGTRPAGGADAVDPATP